MIVGVLGARAAGEPGLSRNWMAETLGTLKRALVSALSEHRELWKQSRRPSQQSAQRS